MIVNKAYCYELEPTAGQLQKFWQHVGTARFAYNWGLARRIEEYETTGKSSTAITQHRQLNALKDTDFPWMYEVSKCAPQEALRDLDRAYENFFRRVKQGRKPGFPKFKRKGVSRDSCRFTGAIKVGHRKIQIPRLGKIRTKEKTDAFAGKILSATLGRDADRWFASLAVEVEIPDPKPVDGPTVGIDLGISCFAVCSDGTRIESPMPLQRSLSLLERRQRRHVRKERGSSNRRRSAVGLARLHRRIRTARSDFLHKASTMLAKTKSAIVVEDLSVRNMMRNHSLARRIADSGWSEFRRQLAYKTKWYGSELIVADKFYPSSKRCSRCGHVKAELSLAERTYTCSACGFEIDRDLNAARNLEQLTTRSSRESHACGDGVRPKRKPRPKRRQSSKKQESAVSVCNG
ncbi:MAG: RNA-guided endonuclease TnpB family protein [Planctomycetota bacterium]